MAFMEALEPMSHLSGIVALKKGALDWTALGMFVVMCPILGKHTHTLELHFRMGNVAEVTEAKWHELLTALPILSVLCLCAWWVDPYVN